MSFFSHCYVKYLTEPCHNVIITLVDVPLHQNFWPCPPPYPHQQDPNDKTKLCPISIGTTYQCVAGTYIMNTSAKRLSALLLQQGQFGVAIQGRTILSLFQAPDHLYAFTN
jgi:hypothetical protein